MNTIIDVGSELLRPVIRSSRWNRGFAAARMAMPETTVHEQGNAPPRKHQVRGAWKIPAMKPEPQPQSVRSSPDADFRRRVLSADPRHQP